ncbi:MAG: hypothetical protein WC678_00950 [Parcubacteria group bacterium]|jgi:hypothetical protein
MEMETEKKEPETAETADCCEKGKCGCEKYKKFLPQVIGVIVLIILIAGVGYYEKVWKKNNLTQKSAKAQVEDFINNNLMQEGTKAEIAEVVKENGMFKVKVKIGEGDQKQEIDSYLSLDGKKFFPSAPMDIEETKKTIAEEKKKTAEPEKEVPKTDKPKVDLFVMSFCPYGNKAEDTLQSVYNLLKNKVDFNFHYIVSSNGDTINSLHGEKEVVQNEREACVLKYFGKDKWVSFVAYVNKNCGSDGACWEAGAKSVGLNSTKIATCVKSEGATLMKADEKISADAQASGSPTMLINGVSTKAVYKYADSESYKQAICAAFNTAPAECAKTLSTSTATTQGGSCN